MDRQPRERIGTEQIDDNEVPSVRSTHGIVSIHEAHVHEGGCRGGPPELAIERQIIWRTENTVDSARRIV